MVRTVLSAFSISYDTLHTALRQTSTAHVGFLSTYSTKQDGLETWNVLPGVNVSGCGDVWANVCVCVCVCVFRERERVCLAQLYSPRLHTVTTGHTHHEHKDTQAENCSVTTLSRQAYVIQHLDAVKNKTAINMQRNTLHRLPTVICSNSAHVV